MSSNSWKWASAVSVTHRKPLFVFMFGPILFFIYVWTCAPNNYGFQLVGAPCTNLLLPIPTEWSHNCNANFNFFIYICPGFCVSCRMLHSALIWKIKRRANIPVSVLRFMWLFTKSVGTLKKHDLLLIVFNLARLWQ